jgi:3-oxoacyl-[acyl-carrier-protein] synthase-3
VRAGQFGSDLALRAAREALSACSWTADSLDVLLVATQTPDRLFPGVAFELHRRLEMRQSAVVFDINLGCSAFTHGLWVAGTLLNGLTGGRALLVNVDTMSRTLAADDYGNQVLFGDAAGATALESDPDASPMTVVLSSDGRGTEAVCLPRSAMSADAANPATFTINGPAVLGLALRQVPRIVADLLADAGMRLEDVGLLVPHQANAFIIDKLVQRLGIDPDRVLVTMSRFGNTSSASIPLALCADTRVRSDDDLRQVMMIGFGTGFSLSGVLADLSTTRFVPPADVA